MKAGKLEIGVRRQESGVRRQEAEEVFLQI